MIRRNSLWILLILSFVISGCIAPRNPLEGIDIPEPDEPDLIYYFLRGSSATFYKQNEKLAQARQDLEQVIELDGHILYPEAYPFLVECYAQLELSDSSEWIYPEAFHKMEQHPILAKKYAELFHGWQESYPSFPEEFQKKDYSLLDTTAVPVGGIQRFYSILEYPEMAKNMNRSGITWLCFMVEADASLTNLLVLKSSYPDLDEAAMDAVQKMTWMPAKYRGKPIPYQMIMPVFFR